jgi:hypothetical protein
MILKDKEALVKALLEYNGIDFTDLKLIQLLTDSFSNRNLK